MIMRVNVSSLRLMSSRSGTLLCVATSCGGSTDKSSDSAGLPPLSVVTLPAEQLQLAHSFAGTAVLKDGSGNAITGRAVKRSTGDTSVTTIDSTRIGSWHLPQ